MSFKERIPPELWEIILDLVIEAGMSPSAQCNSLGFPRVLVSLRSKDNRAPLDHSYEDLRLVCRMFKDLLGPSPRFFMKNGSNIPPRKVRALYIRDDDVSLTWVGIPTADQRNYPNITMLDIVCLITKIANQPASFDALCKKGPGLPGLRNLTLRLKQSTSRHPHNPIWSRINGGFPNLTGLVVMIADRELSLPVLREKELVIFQLMELLAIGQGIFSHGFLAPSLRHISLDSWNSDQNLINGSPLLESILVGNISRSDPTGLRSFPHLQLLGTRQSDVACLFTRDHFSSLSHLWIYAEASNYYYNSMGELINRIPKRMPTVSRITIDISSLRKADRIGVMEALGTCYTVNTGFFLRSGRIGDDYIKLEVPVVSLR